LFFWNYHVSAVLAHADLLAGVQTIIGDPHQLANNVKLVELLSIDTLAGSPSVLLLFGNMLKISGANTRVRYLQLNGEAATGQALRALRKLYPLAGHYSDYSLGEVGQDMGIRTPYCDKQNPSYYHINTKDVYVETVDNELVVTRYATPTVTPLIRYRTGDNISWIGHDECSCGHKGLSIEMSGRQNVDFVRIAGVEIRNDEITNIIGKFDADLEDFTYTEVRDKIINGAQLVTLHIKVVPIKKDNVDLVKLSKRIQTALMKSLRVSSTTMLQEMVTARLFSAPEIEFLPAIPVSNKRQGVKLVTDEI
jgi:phenylacetate-coenzyme A ligase PaaK-like adenylate-forming protein